MSALSTLKSLATAEATLSSSQPPRIIISNGLPAGYTIVNYGCAFYHRRNQNQDPEVVTIEGDRIPPDAQRTVQGTRNDCCRLVIVGIDLELPNGNQVPVFANIEAPNNLCLVQEHLRLEPVTVAHGTSVVAKIS